MPRSTKTSTSEEVFFDPPEGMFDKLLKMNEKLMKSFNERIRECLTKLVENMTVMVQNMMLQVTKSFTDYLTATLTPLLTKLDTINENNVNATANVDTAAKVTTKALLDFEREKNEIERRSSNVIISGLTERPDANDSTVFEEFCERNLTVKPRVIRTRRLGRDKGPASKLCVTLESKSSVDSVISSSRVLRTSPDPELHKVFFNRDLTLMQAEQAYLRRVERRSASRDQPTAPTRPFR